MQICMMLTYFVPLKKSGRLDNGGSRGQATVLGHNGIALVKGVWLEEKKNRYWPKDQCVLCLQ